MTLPAAVAVERAITTFPFSRRYDLHFADARLELRWGDAVRRIGASSLAVGEALAVAKCRSELLERWAVAAWEQSGSPPLDWHDLWSGGPAEPPPAVVAPRRDATGVCAGPVDRRDRVLRHGLLEVLERHAVTRFFDRGEGRFRPPAVGPPEPLARVGRRWGGRFDVFVADDPIGPPVAVVAFSRSPTAGALGSACRGDQQAAVAHAAAEALMMFTTAVHWSRRAEVAPPYRGVVWGSRHIGRLVEELRSATAGRPVAGPAVDGAAVRAAIAERFAGPPRWCAIPSGGAGVSGLGVWRVAVPGARSPADIRRSPWPIG